MFDACPVSPPPSGTAVPDVVFVASLAVRGGRYDCYNYLNWECFNV